MQRLLPEEMKTGHEEIDSQHQDLLRKVDDILKAGRAGRGGEEMVRLLWFLKRYTRKHFRDEEKLQLDCSYPGYPAHKTAHESFVREVKRLEERFASEGASTLLVINTIHMMCDWLKDHFHKMDKDLVAYLRRTRQQGNA